MRRLQLSCSILYARKMDKISNNLKLAKFNISARDYCTIFPLECGLAQLGGGVMYSSSVRVRCTVAQSGCDLAHLGCGVTQLGCGLTQLGCALAQLGCGLL